MFAEFVLCSVAISCASSSAGAMAKAFNVLAGATDSMLKSLESLGRILKTPSLLNA